MIPFNLYQTKTLQVGVLQTEVPLLRFQAADYLHVTQKVLSLSLMEPIPLRLLSVLNLEL